MTKVKKVLPQLHKLQNVDINRHAVAMLDVLLECCTLNLVSSLTGISRVTLYRWLDQDVALDDMNHYHAAWFILHCETNPKVKMLLERGPMSNPRLAKRVIEGDNNEQKD